MKRGGEPVDPFFLPDNCNDNIKRCPMCSVPIERDAGCAQVTITMLREISILIVAFSDDVQTVQTRLLLVLPHFPGCKCEIVMREIM